MLALELGFDTFVFGDRDTTVEHPRADRRGPQEPRLVRAIEIATWRMTVSPGQRVARHVYPPRA